MKKLLSFLVLVSFAFSLFAATSDFADELSSLNLEKIDYTSEGGAESASYASADNRIVGNSRERENDYF